MRLEVNFKSRIVYLIMLINNFKKLVTVDFIPQSYQRPSGNLKATRLATRLILTPPPSPGVRGVARLFPRDGAAGGVSPRRVRGRRGATLLATERA